MQQSDRCVAERSLVLQPRALRCCAVRGIACALSVLCASCPALPCPALPCRAVPCRAVPCPAVPCPALPCPLRPSNGDFLPTHRYFGCFAFCALFDCGLSSPVCALWFCLVTLRYRLGRIRRCAALRAGGWSGASGLRGADAPRARARLEGYSRCIGRAAAATQTRRTASPAAGVHMCACVYM